MNKLIAVVDDESDITELVALHLGKAGFAVKELNEPRGFLKYLHKHKPDLVILDLMLPGTDGLEICKFMKSNKEYSSIPIIMLTAKAEEADKIVGLELGADDYVTKPFSPKELVARVKAVLRGRDQARGKESSKKGRLLEIDRNKHEVIAEGKRIDLTATEFKILELLMSKKGWVFSRDNILDALWGEDKVVIDRTIDVHVKNLREKLGKAGQAIKNVRGTGYKLEL